MIDWPAIYRAARDNCIREYLRYRRRHDDNSKWLRAYWRRRALSRRVAPRRRHCISEARSSGVTVFDGSVWLSLLRTVPQPSGLHPSASGKLASASPRIECAPARMASTAVS